MSELEPRRRRTRSEMNDLRDTIMTVCRNHQPLSVRQLFYLLVTKGVVEKTERSYKRIINISSQLRITREMPFDWIVDESRRRMHMSLHKSPGEALWDLASEYNFDYQSFQSIRLEVLTEKETLSGVLWPICAKYRIDLLPCKGTPSLTYRYGAAVTANQDGRPFKILYIGDSDPAGERIDRVIDSFMREHLTVEWLGLKRIAITDQQRDELNLPTRAPKETGAKAGRHAEIGCVEAEALPPEVLRSVLIREIESHLDADALARAKLEEVAQRETILAMVTTLGDYSHDSREVATPSREIILYQLSDGDDTKAEPMDRSNPMYGEFWSKGWAKDDTLHSMDSGEWFNLLSDSKPWFEAYILSRNPLKIALKRP